MIDDAVDAIVASARDHLFKSVPNDLIADWNVVTLRLVTHAMSTFALDYAVKLLKEVPK